MHKGALSAAFSVGAHGATPAEQEKINHYNALQSVAMGAVEVEGETVAGFRVAGVAAAANERRELKKGEERTKQQILIRQQAQQLEQWLERMEALLEEINEIQDRIDQLTEDKRLLRETITAAKAGDMPELDENGGLRNARLEAMVRAQEAKRGQSVDRGNQDALLDILYQASDDTSISMAQNYTALSDAVERFGDIENKIDNVHDNGYGTEESFAVILKLREERDELVQGIGSAYGVDSEVKAFELYKAELESRDVDERVRGASLAKFSKAMSVSAQEFVAAEVVVTAYQVEENLVQQEGVDIAATPAAKSSISEFKAF